MCVFAYYNSVTFTTCKNTELSPNSLSATLLLITITIKSIGTCQKDTQNQDKKRKTIRRSQATCDKKITPRCLCVLVYGEPTGEWMNEEKRGSQVGRLLVNIARAAAIIIIITIFGGLYSYPALPCPDWHDIEYELGSSFIRNRESSTKQVSFCKSIAEVEGKWKQTQFERVILSTTDHPPVHWPTIRGEREDVE